VPSDGETATTLNPAVAYTVSSVTAGVVQQPPSESHRQRSAPSLRSNARRPTGTSARNTRLRLTAGDARTFSADAVQMISPVPASSAITPSGSGTKTFRQRRQERGPSLLRDERHRSVDDQYVTIGQCHLYRMHTRPPMFGSTRYHQQRSG
jgi:hypothetical protein